MNGTGQPVIIHWREDGADSEEDLLMTVNSIRRWFSLSHLVIVGDKPSWGSDLIHHVPFSNPYEKNKDANIIHACIKGALFLLELNYSKLSHALVASDDCMMLGPHPRALIMEEKAVNFWRNFPERVERNKWWKRPYGSLVYALELGAAVGNFDAHVPQLFRIQSILDCIDAPIGERDLSAKTLIASMELMESPNRKIVDARDVKLTTERFPTIAKRGLKRGDPRVFVNWSNKTRTPELLKEARRLSEEWGRDNPLIKKDHA